MKQHKVITTGAQFAMTLDHWSRPQETHFLKPDPNSHAGLDPCWTSPP